ncbi:MAG: hypothetical protein ABI383_13090 [Acidobacteriaceae bacterium]
MNAGTQTIGTPAAIQITISDQGGQPTVPPQTNILPNGTAYFNNTTGKNVLLNLQTSANIPVQLCIVIPAGNSALTVCPPPSMANGECPYTLAYSLSTGSPKANNSGGRIIIGSGIAK